MLAIESQLSFLFEDRRAEWQLLAVPAHPADSLDLFFKQE